MDDKKNKQKSELTGSWIPLKKLRENSIRAANKPDSQSNHKFYIWVIIIAMALPLLGWAVGAVQNPTGWALRYPLSAYLFIIALAMYFWPISLIVVSLVVFMLVFSKASGVYALKLISSVIFIASLVLSIVIMTFVEQAETSEFTD